MVGLYLNPPDAAVVLCVDEKSIQALDRTAPVLPLIPGTPERRTHDYRRHGTTNLYAALDIASGHVIADMTPRHHAEEFRRFLNLIDRSVPAELDVHVIVDNNATHKNPGDPPLAATTPPLHAALHRPTARGSTSSSGGSPNSPTTGCAAAPLHPRELVASIRTWITNWNRYPKPFIWHKTADEILDFLANYCQRIDD